MRCPRGARSLCSAIGTGSADWAALHGLAASFALAPLMRTLLFETTMHDVGVLLSVGVVLIFVAGAASVVPAWRASRVSPSVSLQTE